MKAFFDSLDAKMAVFFKAKFGKKAPAAGAKTDLIDPDDIGSPIFLMVGSLSGCSAKDATAYARGLAETYITSPEIARIRVFEDKAGARFIYELQEGGPGFSIIEPVLEQLAAGHKVRVPLTNGAQVVIEEANNEVFSLVYPASNEVISAQLPGLETETDEGALWRIEDLCNTTELKELYPQNKKLVHVGGIILGVAGAVFMLTGGIYTVTQSGALDGDALLRQTKAGIIADANDNPVWQLDKARMAAEQEGKTLRALKKTPSGWKWELNN